MNPEQELNIRVDVQDTQMNFPALQGENLWRVLVENGVFLESDCGGRGNCGRCGVAADPTNPDSETPACRINIDHSLHIALPKTRRKRPRWSLMREDIGPLLLGIDLGLTTVGLYVTDMLGAIVAGTSYHNPQVTRGFDAVTRLQAAKDPQVRMNIAESLRKSVRTRLELLQPETEINPERIRRAVIVGNGASMILALGLDGKLLLETPPKNIFSKQAPLQLKANIWGLPDGTPTHFLSPAGGFLGSDAAVGAWAVGFKKFCPPKAYIDLGTACEVIISDGSSLYGTSAAIAPAFEGGGLSCGMGPAFGALFKVETASTGGLRPQSLGGGTPVGLSGAGITSVIRYMLEAGVINESGRFKPTAELQSVGDDKRWQIPFKEKNPTDLYVTMTDVRQFQLAKSAVAGSLSHLLSHAGMKLKDLQEIVVTGPFSVNMNLDDLQKLGVIPTSIPSRFHRDGAGKGAAKAASNEEALEQAKMVIDQIEYVDLTANDEFHTVQSKHLALIPFDK